MDRLAQIDLQINTIAINRNVKRIPSTFSFEANDRMP